MSGNQYRRHQPSAIVALTLLMVYLPGCFGGLNIRAENEDEDEITESHCEPATGPGTDVASTAGGPHLYWASSESNLIEREAADLSRFFGARSGRGVDHWGPKSSKRTPLT